MNPKKLRKKITRLRKKGELNEAIELQRQLCQIDQENTGDWSQLAEMALEAKMPDVELATRFHIAKITHAGPEDWVKLAHKADNAGFDKDAADAWFRAADAAALTGQTRRSVELCDQVLAKDPDHRPARRIRSLMAARLLRMEAMGSEETDEVTPPPVSEWEEESTLTFLRRSEITGGREISAGEMDDFDELTPSNWIPPEPELGSETAPTPAGFVCAPQRWPSVLDRQCLMFVGKIDEIEDDVLALAEPISLAAGSSVYSQGKIGQLLYCLDDGEVRASRERGFVQDLGTIAAGFFFGEVVTIAGFPSTTKVETVEESALRVITREKFHRHLKEGTTGVGRLISTLRSFYLETVVNICPVFAFCNDEELSQLTDKSHWVTFKADEMMAEQDKEGPLHVIMTGVAQVILKHEDKAITLGYLSSGDLVGEMVPSPVTVIATCTVLAIAIDRKQMLQLPEVAQAEIKKRFAKSQRALQEVIASS